MGNNREVWLANTGATVQRTQYYPSGLPWEDGLNPSTQNKKYNGKEFVEAHGYDTYDIVWRQYYPAVVRFQTIDPEAEEDYDISPYAMCGNNMVMNTDPDGRLFGVDNLVGAVVGAAIDYGGQVAANMISGDSFKEALTDNISYGSIIVSAGEGFLTSGGSAIGKVAETTAKVTAKTVVKEIAKEGAKAAAGQVIDNAIKGKKLTQQVGTTTVAGMVSGVLSVKKGSIVENQKTLNRLERKENPTHRQQKIIQSTKKTITSTQRTNVIKSIVNSSNSSTVNKVVQKIDDIRKKNEKK